MPLFTTIIPTFNRADLLRQTLESIRGDCQIIVVDDGSTDGTMELLAGYGSKLTVLRQTNRGPGAARNLGLSAAAGDYIAFLDSDDLWFPWTLDVYRNVIESNQSPSFIAGKPFLFSDPNALQSQQSQPIQILQFADYFASGDEWRWFGVSSFVIRRDALVAVGGFTDMAVNGEDADLAMKLGIAPGFVQVTSPATFGYRQHGGNITGDAMKCYRGLSLHIQQEQNDRYPGGSARKHERHRIITRHARSGALSLARAGYGLQAWEIYRRTLAWNAGLGRWKYLAAAPAIILAASARGRR